MSTSSREAWVRSLLPTAQAWEQRTGIPASTWLAMAASESNWGAAGNALFGIKGHGSAGSLNSPTWESEGGQRVNTNADFAQYNDPNEAFQAFWNLVSTTPRYAEAMQYLPDNPQGFIQAINRAGYATDPKWASSIQNIASTSIEPMVSSLTRRGGGEPRYMGRMQEGKGLTPEQIAQAMGQGTPGQTSPGQDLSPDTAPTPPTALGGPAGTTQGTQQAIPAGGYAGAAWQSQMDLHDGIAGITSSKSIQVTDPAHRFEPNPAKIWVPDPNAPSMVAFNDGTTVLAHLTGKDPYLADAAHVVAMPGTTTRPQNPDLQVFPDGSLQQYFPDFPGANKWVKIADPRDPTDKKTPKTMTLGDGRVVQWNWDTKTWDTIFSGQKAPITQSWPDGSLHAFDPSTGNWTELAPADPNKQTAEKLAIAQAQRNLMPDQLKLFNDARDSVDAISSMWAAGKISDKERDQYTDEIHHGLQSSLAGTTLFQQYQEEQRKKEAQATQASTMLRQRMSEGTALAHNLLATAAGHVLMPAGATSLGIDPYAIARAEVNELGGGADLFNQAAATLKGYVSPSTPGVGGGPQSQQDMIKALLPALTQNAPQSQIAGPDGIYPGGTPVNSPGSPVQNPSQFGNMYTPMRQEAFTPQGPRVASLLAQQLMATAPGGYPGGPK